MAPYNFKFAFAVVFLVFAGSAFCDDPKPGKWQKGPLTCLTCSDLSDCEKPEENKESECKKTDDPCVTIFDDTEDKVKERGCASELNTECKEGTCFKCISSNCNKAKSKDDFVECISCDSSKQEKCVTDLKSVTETRKCYGNCIVALYPKDESGKNAGFELVRSCLDDKKEEDQAKCGSDDKNCKSCKSSKCNNFEFPENRLSCFQCKGKECDDDSIKSTPCPIHKEGDTCVFIFNEKMIFTEAQCKSSLPEDEVKQLEEDGQLHSCPKNGCNEPTKKPKIPECFTCDSTEDCASKAGSLTTFTPCSFNFCFTQIKDDGTTKRGCFNDLKTSEKKDCKEDNKEGCTQCKEDKCNNKIFPKDRRQCHKCDSSNEPDCEGNPKSSVICPIYYPGNEESCVTEFNPQTKKTKRGCHSELINCKDNDPNCQICKKDNCNTDNLKEKNSNDPKPGKWQKGPLTCFTCNGLSGCEKPEENKESECKKTDDPCVTIFDDTEDKVKERGCASELNTECKEGTCFKCISSNCNKAKSKDDFVECISCDSSKQEKCVTDLKSVTETRKCYGNCMVALYPKDESGKNAGFELVRSCLDDKKEEDQAKCGSDDKNCKSCKSPKCNNFEFPENRLSCFQCKGKECDDDSIKSTPCPIHKEGDTCVFIFNEKMIFTEAQCKSSLPEDEVKQLEEDGQLHSCPKNGCNEPTKKPKIPECFTCDSTEDCASKADSLTTFTPCSFNFCFTQIKDDGTTKRGCFNDLKTSEKKDCKEDNKEGCTQCKEDKCNNKIFPKDRRQCHKCDSSNEPDCEGNPKSSVICPIYYPGNEESCVTEFNPQTKKTKRGCHSELINCKDNDPNCQICKKDNCNTDNLKEKNSNDPKPGKWQKGPLTCFTCNGLSGCEKPEENKESECKKTDDPCVTIFDDTEDKVKERGCASELNTECKEGTCFKCISSNCNKAKSKDDFVECISCDSSKQEKCVTDLKSVTETRKCYGNCMVALYPKDESGKNAGFELVRSCLDDKKEEDQAKCGSDDKNCKSCKSPKCNNFEFPENRLSCFQCKGKECDDDSIKSTPCPIHKEGDTCVFIFNEKMIFTEAQCKSSLPEDEVKQLEEDGQLHSCPKNGCNEPTKKPKIPECFTCDSTEDCASKPGSLTKLTTCNFNYCFSQIKDDGTTKRGCFNDLKTSEKKDCKEDNKEGCTRCKKDKCNNQIFPKDRRQCRKCDSSNEPDCEGNPKSSVICPYYYPGNKESCVTKYNPETKVTTRGCGTEFPCKGNNQKKCQICKQDVCNTDNLREKNSNDPEPGKWQKLPLKCLKCNSENECKSSTLEEDCQVETDPCVTVFNDAGIVIKRGCATATKSDCKKEENDCYKCVSNKCNRANDKTKYKSCLSCDTKSNPKCLSDATSIKSTRDCYESCMVALYPRESGPDPSYELVRTCLDDKDEDARIKCDGSDISCKMCNGDNCNHFLYPENRLKCYQCQGEACKSEVKSSYCPSFKQNDACVFIFENNVFFAADCKSSLPSSRAEELEQAGQLFSCAGDNCNALEKTPKMPSCLACDSTEDENCATNPETLGTTTTCNFKYCYSQVLENGATQRGCFANLDPTLQGLCTTASTEPCTQCKGDNCNIQIYPANRRKCHRCISTKDQKCAAEPDKTEVCPKYVADDSCVTHFEKKDKVTKRGCFSEFPCDGKDEKQCQVCKTADSCNTVNLEKLNGAMGIYLTVGAVLAMLCHLVL